MSGLNDDTIRGSVYDPGGEFDEDGFHLRFATDDDSFDLRIFDIETARAMVKSVEPLKDWIADHDHHRAEYDRATPEEIARVVRDEEALVEGDPVGDFDAEVLREQADINRKAEKENR